MLSSEDLSQKIEDCRELYLKYGGREHELIEKEMRELGYRDFHRRSLYRRFERGTCKPGWIETYGWRHLVREQESTRLVDTTKSSPPYEGGVADASSDGVVLSRAPDQHCVEPQAKNHPDATASPLLRKEGSTLTDFDEFKEWLKSVSPSMQWEWKHQVYIYKHLKCVTEGLCKRLMIFMPPRHGKSEMVTARYTAWRLKKDPSMNVIVASYNQTLAKRFSRKIKRVLCDDWNADAEWSADTPVRMDAKASRHDTNIHATQPTDTRHAGGTGVADRSVRAPSPFPFVSSRPKNTEAEWETTMGGGLRAVGVGSGVTGFGADLIIIDDPVKSRAEAESKTYRDRLWNWFNDDIYTRLEPDGSIILIQTRWHEDDLAGRLLRESAEEGTEQWTVVNLPALAELRNAECGLRNEEEVTSNEGQAGGNAGNAGIPACQDAKASYRDANIQSTEPADTPHAGGTGIAGRDACVPADPLGRSIGEALWPQRYNEETLGRYKRRLGSYSFAALYQQRPTPAEGGLFKRAWFRTINSPPPNLKWKRGYDLGISKNADADYTASLRIAFDRPGNMYIDGGFRRRIEYPEQRRYILGRIAAERDTHHGVELSANGNAVIQDLRRERNVQGRMLRGVKVKGDKVTQALPWIALAEEGRVFLVRGPWNDEFIDEAASFPQGTHDDQIDAVSIAVRMHREQSGKLVTC